ncbi:MAG: energy-coupling factor ABC transporter substrate-binding protein [Firmicutes bacterium HGW-Firmicutes-2]|jgi:cobalt/nickel transport protein|nr:MAG: energy-coupling factor ABC transporter substrate-binding protein [Firmicutes bacterium HGW-Firmicutes-2]
MKTKQNLILIGIVILLAITPLIINPNSEYKGADGAAQDQIILEYPDYEPWFTPFFEPASGEIESFFFSMQAAIGAGFIAYFFGRMKGRQDNAKH